MYQELYYIQSTDEQIKNGALRVHLQLDVKKLNFATTVYTMNKKKMRIDTSTFNTIRHLTADINRRQGLRIDAKP